MYILMDSKRRFIETDRGEALKAQGDIKKDFEVERYIYKLFADFQFLKAAEILEKALEERKEAKLFHNLGAAYYKTGNFSQAQRTLEEAVRLDGKSSKSLYLLGLILKDQGRLADAVTFFSRAVGCDETFSRGYLQRGICYFLDGRHRQAREDLERALALEPDSLWPQYNLAIVKITLNDWRGAKEALEKCITLDAGHVDKYSQLLVEMGKAEVFRELYTQSHRMKNMLSILGNNLRKFLEESGQILPEARKNELNRIIENQDKLYSDFVSYLSTLKREPIELDIVDVHDIVDGALLGLGTISGEVALRKRIEDGIPEIICDSSLMKEAVLNVLLNAVEAVGDGGIIEVVVSRQDRERICITVTDNGCGIRKEDLGRIFDFGYSTKSFGSGIGLSQAKRTIQMHGGRIDCESGENKGTVFRILLPVNPKVEETLANISLRPALFEDLRDLLIVPEIMDELLL